MGNYKQLISINNGKFKEFVEKYKNAEVKKPEESDNYDLNQINLNSYKIELNEEKILSISKNNSLIKYFIQYMTGKIQKKKLN
jgi:hypothetical protein